MTSKSAVIKSKQTEITEEFLKDFSRAMLEKARINLEKDKFLASMIFFLRKSEVYVIPALLVTEQDKTTTEILIKEAAKKLFPEAVIFLSDGWGISLADDSRNTSYVAPSKHPERKECITLSIVTKGHKSWGLMQFYKRENDTIKFDDIIETNDSFCRFIDDVFVAPISKNIH